MLQGMGVEDGWMTLAIYLFIYLFISSALTFKNRSKTWYK